MGMLFKRSNEKLLGSANGLLCRLRRRFSSSEDYPAIHGGTKLQQLEPRLLMAADVVISEFMANNGTTLDDEDGDSSDWIELSNVGDEVADLAGMFLTDNDGTLNKWTLPALQLNPGEQIVIFASGKDRTDPQSELHTNFQLNRDGEYLALVDVDGVTVLNEFAPEFPNQELDVSYGIGQTVTQTPLIDETSGVSYSFGYEAGFEQNGFDDSGWTAGVGALGYDDGPVGTLSPIGGYWLLNDGVGGNGDMVVDVTGQNDGVLDLIEDSSDWVTDTAPTTFANSHALDFDGTDDYIQTNFSGIGGASARTVSAWVKTSATDEHGIVAWGNSSGNGQKWHMRVNNNAGNGTVGALRVEVQGGFIIGTTQIADDEWHLLTAVFPNGATNVSDVQLYIDGELETTTSINPEPINTSLAHDQVTIGRRTQGVNNHYVDALIDDIRFYDRGLSGAEIDELGTNPTATNLVAHWAFDEGAGDVAGDSTGTYSGTLMNMRSDATDVWVNDAPPIGEDTSLFFDGIDAGVITEYPGVGGVDDRTISFWVKTTDTSDHGIVNWGDSYGDGAKYHARLNSAAGDGVVGAVRLETQNGRIVGVTPIADDQWHHVAILFENDGTPDNEDVQIYVDGVLEPSTTSTPIPINTNISDDAADPVWIGKRMQQGVLRAFEGQLSDVAIFEGVLTPAQIASLADGTTRPDDVGSYFDLIDTDVSTLPTLGLSTLMARYEFALGGDASFEQLFLDMQYDDGFVAYLNGVEVARRNAPGALEGTSVATGNHTAGNVETINISAFIDELNVGGDNVLALVGLNEATDDGDFLVGATLRGVDIENGVVGYFAEPTPGAANTESFEGFVGDTNFTFDRGFYGAPFQLEILSSTVDAAIYYTTDGTKPGPGNPAAVLYDMPIDVTTTTTIRAAAYADNLIPTNVDTHTYLFAGDVKNQSATPVGFPTAWGTRTTNYEMDPDVVNDPMYSGQIESSLMSLPVISIVSDQDDFFSGATGIIPNSSQRGDSWEREVSIEFFNFEHGDDLQTDAGLRMVGRASRSANRNGKHNMRLAFRSDYGDPRLDFKLFNDSFIEDFDSIMLRGGNGDSYVNPNTVLRAQYMRDQWHRETMRDMGHFQPHQIYTHLYINGLYWGMYHIFERSDADMMANYFGGEQEDYDIVKDGGSVSVLEAQDGNLDAWNEMLDVVNGGSMTDARFDELAELIDMDNFIDYMMMNFYSGNNDWDQSNWRAARNRNGGKWIFFAHDSERTDLNANGLGNNVVAGPANRDVTGVNHNNFPSMIHQKLSTNAKYQRLFANHAQQNLFNDGALTAESSSARLNELADVIRPAMVAESARWGDTHSAVPRTPDNQWEPYITTMIDTFFSGRSEIFVEQLRARGLFPDVDAPVFEVNGEVQHGGGIGLTDAVSIVPLGGPNLTVTNTLVADNAASFTHIPLDDTLGTSWTLNSFDPAAAGWIAGNLGVGYETGTGYEPYIQTDVNAAMNGVSVSAFISTTFNHDDSITYETLSLNMRYDDAFIAYLNGTEIFRTGNIITDGPGSATLTTGHEAIGGADMFDVFAFENLLLDGENTLAIHGINAAIGSSDFLMQPSLVGTYTSTEPINDPIYYTTDGSDVLLENGTLNPEASLYESPLMFGASTQVNAVQYDGETYSAQTSALFAVDVPLRVTEIHYNPDGDDGAAFIELMNVGGVDIDLTGIGFVRNDLLEGIEFKFLDTDVNLILPGGQRIVIAKDLTVFETIHPNVPSYLVAERAFSGSLSNGGEALTLVDAAGAVIQQFTYEDGGGADEMDWTDKPDGNGPSLDLIDPAGELSSWNEGSSWRASGMDQGTPGRPDPVDAAIEGDANYDGTVNLEDLAKLATNFGRSAVSDPLEDVRWLHGDFTGDGIVDLADLAKLATNFGTSGSDGFPTGGGAGADEGTDLLAATEKGADAPLGALLVNTEARLDSPGGESWDHIGSLLDEEVEDGVV